MNTKALIKDIFKKILKRKVLIIVGGIILAALLFFKARSTKAEYTSKATVFPLTNASDNALSSSALNNILGIEETPKSFTGEASISIIELATSRNIRESVAASRIAEFGNKTVTELIVPEKNKIRSFFSKAIELPADSTDEAVLGGRLLANDMSARMNKNGVLELYFTSTNPDIITPISNKVVAVISQFYINLRIEKATADYLFTLKKIDSLQKVMDGLDVTAVNMQNVTLFTPVEKLQYSLPKENLADEKTRVSREKDIAINNREEALWRLQKITPIIATLDKPTPPFDVQKPSSLVYGFTGFIIGCLLTALILVSGIIFRFIKDEIYKIFAGV